MTEWWYAWIAAFVALEGYAIVKKRKGGTLSAKVWDWFDIRSDDGKWTLWQGRKLARLKQAGLAAGLLWLAVHFLSGGAV